MGWGLGWSSGGFHPGWVLGGDDGVDGAIRGVGALEIAGGEQELADDLAASEAEGGLE